MTEPHLRTDRVHVDAARAARADRRRRVAVLGLDAGTGHAVAAPAGRAPDGSAGRLGPYPTMGPECRATGLDGSAAEDSAQHYALDHSARPGAAFRTVMSASHPSRMTTGHAPGRHGWTPTVDRAGTGTGAWRS